MIWLIVFGSITGIALIFFRRYKDANRQHRLKVPIERREPQQLHQTSGLSRTKWKKQELDFKAINETFNRADMYYSKGNYDEAQKWFVQVLALNPDHLEANNKLGLICMHKNVPARAEAIFRKLIELSPRNPIFFSNLGLALYTQSHLEEAKESYVAATMYDSKKESRFLSLGLVCVELEHFRDAINAYSKALNLNPKNLQLYFTITDLLIKIKAYDEALAFMKSLLDTQPYNEEAKEKSREIKIAMGTNPLANG